MPRALTAGTGCPQTASLTLRRARADQRAAERRARGGRGAVCPEPGFGKSSRLFPARAAAGACLPGRSRPQGPSPSFCIHLPLALVGHPDGLECVQGTGLPGTAFPPAESVPRCVRQRPHEPGPAGGRTRKHWPRGSGAGEAGHPCPGLGTPRRSLQALGRPFYHPSRPLPLRLRAPPASRSLAAGKEEPVRLARAPTVINGPAAWPRGRGSRASSAPGRGRGPPGLAVGRGLSWRPAYGANFLCSVSA